MLDIDSRPATRAREAVRVFLRVSGLRSERDAEYSFVKKQLNDRHQMRILDVGAVGSILPLVLADRGHLVTVCDVRPYPEHHRNLAMVRGDFLDLEFATDSFDAVVFVSTIEHFGFGSYGDRRMQDADLIALQQARRILGEGGRLILTTPFTATERIIEGFERWYDQDRLERLLSEFEIIRTEYWAPKLRLGGRYLSWAEVGLDEAQKAERVYGHHATVCVVGRKRAALPDKAASVHNPLPPKKEN